MSDTQSNGWRAWLSILSIVIIILGGGIAWGILETKVSNNREDIQVIEEEKLDQDVYRADLKRIEDKLDDIKSILQRRDSGLLSKNNPN